MPTANLLYQVSLPRGACFGIEVENGRVINAAPIGRWMVGKSLSTVESWVYKQRGRLEYVSTKNSS